MNEVSELVNYLILEPQKFTTGLKFYHNYLSKYT